MIKIDSLELPDDEAYEVWGGYRAPAELASAVTLGGRYLYELQPLAGGQEIVLSGPEDGLVMPSSTWDALAALVASPQPRTLNYRGQILPVLFDYTKTQPITASLRLYGDYDGERIGWAIYLRAI